MFVLSVEDAFACIWEGREDEAQGLWMIAEELTDRQQLPETGRLEDGYVEL